MLFQLNVVILDEINFAVKSLFFKWKSLRYFFTYKYISIFIIRWPNTLKLFKIF